MNIDPKTGLPELPIHRYWEIVKDRSPYGDSSSYHLLLMEKVDKLKLVRKRHRWDFLANLGFKQWVEPSDKQITDWEIRTHYKAADEDDARAKAVEWGEPWYAGQISRYSKDWHTINSELSKDNILATAKRIIEAQNRIEERKANEAQFLGTFPPKRID